jgi:quercetin dioxygenase-like cupin family protein
MRSHVPRLDTTAMPWARGAEMPGLRTKMLSADPETGARTALQCIDPAHGYRPPTTAHYHPIDEEIFILKGRFRFDGKQWLVPYAYCFHPADTVHGFKSLVAEESWFLSRVTRPLEFGFVEQPSALEPYPRTGVPPERAICIIPDPLSRAWQTDAAAGKMSPQRLVLSRHPRTGEGSMLVRFPPGWVSPHPTHYHTVYCERFVLEGALESEDGAVFGAGCYSFEPPHTLRSALSSPAGALVYLNFGGPLDFLPERKSRG